MSGFIAGSGPRLPALTLAAVARDAVMALVGELNALKAEYEKAAAYKKLVQPNCIQTVYSRRACITRCRHWLERRLSPAPPTSASSRPAKTPPCLRSSSNLRSP